MSFLIANRALIAAFIVLLVLLGVNIAFVLLPAGSLAYGLHLATAVAMAVVIGALFMRLRSMGALLRVFALAGLMWLAFMWVLMPVDYVTR